MNRRMLTMILLALAAVLVLAACGGGGDSSGDDSATATTQAPSGGDSATDTTKAPSGGDSATDTTKAPSGGDNATDTTKAPSGGGSSEQSHAIVEGIQKDLKTTGYYQGEIDGLYGPQTTEAIKELQRDASITVDGRWGPETQKAMETALGTAQSDAVKELQSELKDLGYYSGDVDGVYGESTVIAVTNLQQDCGIELDGIYGPETHSCLVDLGGDGDA